MVYAKLNRIALPLRKNKVMSLMSFVSLMSWVGQRCKSIVRDGSIIRGMAVLDEK